MTTPSAQSILKAPPSDSFGVNTHPDAAEERGDGIKTAYDRINARYANQTTLDFGAFPGASDTSVAVTGQSTIQADSIVECWIEAIATADHTADEHIANPPRVYAGNIVAGTGFTIYGVNDDRGDQLTYGTWTVGWRWN